MKVLVTGAHFTPAVAVIEELKKIPGAKIVYVGRKTTLEGDKSVSIESEVLPSLGVKFIPLITGRLQRTFTFYTIPSLLKIPFGLVQSLYIILSEKPDVVLSFGGYVAVPVVIVAWFFSIPIIIHEQTLVPGLANKISTYFADKICLSFPQNFLGKKEKSILTGNPLRKEVLNPPSAEGALKVSLKNARKANLPVVLVTGGNQGSHVLNLAIEEVLGKLTKIAFIIHVTGENKYKDLERLKSIQNKGYLVKKWIGKEWGMVLSNSDILICRAGINTLTEAAFLQKPALAIPIPYLYQDEQNKNAKFFENLGFIKILPQSKLTGESLFQNIKEMIKGLPVLKEKAKEAKKTVILDAAKRLALETTLLSKNPI